MKRTKVDFENSLEYWRDLAKMLREELTAQTQSVPNDLCKHNIYVQDCYECFPSPSATPEQALSDEISQLIEFRELVANVYDNGKWSERANWEGTDEDKNTFDFNMKKFVTFFNKLRAQPAVAFPSDEVTIKGAEKIAECARKDSWTYETLYNGARDMAVWLRSQIKPMRLPEKKDDEGGMTDFSLGYNQAIDDTKELNK